MKISTQTIAPAVLAICVLSLAFALTAQYGFGLRPCNLCLIQRVPFVLAALLAAAALARPGKAPLLLRLAGLVLAVNGLIAFYHVGVEQHWWASAACSGGGGGPVSVADLMAEMSKPAEAQCDTPAWEYHGITMALLNVPFSLGLGLAVLALLRRKQET
ncbi:disulfide bond formation protein DsbB [Paramagnetospirillum marisnigri]|uniref:Disulfide bond formation protein DsbB n=1 Tax=Paramagnetospirillum marisnigri TaxID=1285242 RepID=A0A178MNU2_9PROT|nr:disulfide bond formation protein B [Paramagnetospirillum marisnigri]OAN49798.1 disulfide bond formation protein DsbB [Paramagnetospirillum marisnigri]